MEAGIDEAVSVLRSSPPSSPKSLEAFAASVYLDYLEEECAAFVALLNLNSPIWNPVKNRMLKLLKEHIDQFVAGQESSNVRRKLLTVILSGEFPSERHRNEHVALTDKREVNHEDEEEQNHANIESEKIKRNGRKCCNACCTGAFIVEAMLAVILNADIEEIDFPRDFPVCKVFKKRHPIRRYINFDVSSVLFHYMGRLKESTRPNLRKMIIGGGNLGTVDAQVAKERVLNANEELKKYYDFAAKFSGVEQHRASTHHAMLALEKLFSRSESYFVNLHTLSLTGECFNTRLNTQGGHGGFAATQVMAAIAHSCPRLEVIDLSLVASLSPECLLYLFYRDAFAMLHKYTYLMEFHEGTDGSISQGVVDSVYEMALTKKHDGRRYCPWCECESLPTRKGCERDTSVSLYIVDDRLFDHCENFKSRHSRALTGDYQLLHCVKVGDLLRSFNDDVFLLKDSAVMKYPRQGETCDYVRKPMKEEQVKSNLCSSLRRLLLPLDVVDCKAWLVPLALKAATRLESLGDTSACEGFKVTEELDLLQHIQLPTRLEEVNVSLEETSKSRIKEQFLRRMKSLSSQFHHWTHFTSDLEINEWGFESAPTLSGFIDEEFEKGRFGKVSHIRDAWTDQLVKIGHFCPDLKALKISIQPWILSVRDKDFWKPLLRLRGLREVYIYSSTWADAQSLLDVVGFKLAKLNLMLNSPKTMKGEDASRLQFVNTIPRMCPNLEELRLGYIPGDTPHSLSWGLMPPEDKLAYPNLVYFEATGNITLDALTFLWKQAPRLETLRVSGGVVNRQSSAEEGNANGESFVETAFNNDRVVYLFELNPMRRLKVFDIQLTLTSILAAKTLLGVLPKDIKSIATLNVKVSIPESLEGESFGDLVSSVLARMASFKSECVQHNADIVWNWKREGILTILLQQQSMMSFSDLIDP